MWLQSATILLLALSSRYGSSDLNVLATAVNGSFKRMLVLPLDCLVKHLLVHAGLLELRFRSVVIPMAFRCQSLRHFVNYFHCRVDSLEVITCKASRVGISVALLWSLLCPSGYLDRMDQKSQPPLCQLDLGFPSMAGRFLWTQLPAWSNEDHAGNQRIERS